MVIVTYYKDNKDSSLIDPSGVITFNQSLTFSSNSSYKLHVISASINSSIPNIYSTTEYSNNTFEIILTDSTSTAPNIVQVIELDRGIYDSRLITLAIKNVVNQLNWSNDTDISPIRFESNIALQKIVLIIDNSLVNTSSFPQYDGFAINLGGYSNFASLLGFNPTLYNESTEAQSNAQLDLFGNSILIEIEGFGYLSYLNESQSFITCTIPLADLRGNLYLVEGHTQPYIDIEPPSHLRQLTVNIYGDRDNQLKRKIYLMDGAFRFTFEIIEA